MGIETVQKLLPVGSKVLLLEDFVREYAPDDISSSFPGRAREAAVASSTAATTSTSTATTTIVPKTIMAEMEWVKQTEERTVSSAGFLPEELRGMIIAPLKTCRVLRRNHCNRDNKSNNKSNKKSNSNNSSRNPNRQRSRGSTSHCREPVRTLVDDVVYSLVHRWERLQRRRKCQEKRQLLHGRKLRSPPPSLSSSTTTTTTATATAPEHPSSRASAIRTSTNVDASSTSTPVDSTHTHEEHDDDPGRNVLVRGFAISREGDGPPPPGMKAGISYRYPNENVTFWKSSPVVRRLHELVGDEVLRLLLLHTRCFLPVLSRSNPDPARASGNGGAGNERATTGRKRKPKRKRTRALARTRTRTRTRSDANREDNDGNNDDTNTTNNNGNYILLCGPPLDNANTCQRRAGPAGSNAANHSIAKRMRASTDSTTNTSRNKKRATNKKQRRCFSNASQFPSHPHLRPNENISRCSLMYCDAYIPHVTLPKSHPFRQRIERQKPTPKPTQTKFQSTSLPDGNAETLWSQRQSPDADDDADYRFVSNVVFELHLEKKNKQRRIRKRLEGRGRMVCERLWKNFASGTPCQNYGRLLERYCPLPEAYLVERKATANANANADASANANASPGFAFEDNDKDNERLARLSRAFTPKEEIVSFLGSVLRTVFPTAFWGSERNFQSVMVSVRFFVRLRRDERLTNKTIMHGISVTEMEWLYPSDSNNNSNSNNNGDNNRNGNRNGNSNGSSSSSNTAGETSPNHRGRNRCEPKQRRRNRKQRTNHETATELTLKALRWVFRGFIIPLLRSTFYVTETEFSAKEIQYYRKPVWSLFRAISVRKVTSMTSVGKNSNSGACNSNSHNKHFAILSLARARKNLMEQSMGLSRLRFVPKSSGMRPIAQLSRSARIRFPPTIPTSSSTSTSSTSTTPSTNRVGVGSGSNSKKRTRAGGLLQPEDSGARKMMHLRTQPPATRNRSIGPARDRIGALQPFESKQASSSFRLPTNVILGKVLEVLKYECDRREKPFGNGIDHLGSFYTRYRNYISGVKQQQRINEKSTNAKMQLFFAKVDIEKCYDRINKDYLLGLVRDLVLNNTYVLQRVRLDSEPTASGGTSVQYKKIVETVDEYQSFHSREHALARRKRKTVFDLLKCTLAERKTILDLLEEHLLRHTVVTSGRYERKVLLQCSGISQGSTLSMLLCNLYYGRVEELMFRGSSGTDRDPSSLETGADLMSRFVDDFLFISPDRASFQRFLDCTYRGKFELGARINPKKSLTNVKSSVRVSKQDGSTVDMPVPQSNRLDRNGSVLFPWCGLLFDPEKGEVFNDYERFQNGKLRDSITIDYNGNEGRRMENRIRTFVHPRCLPILYDSSINSFETAAFNFYQMMLFAACKTAEYMRGHAVCNTDHILKCVRDLPRYARFIIRCGFVSTRTPPQKEIDFDFDFGTVFAIDETLASLLSWNAFCDVFSYLAGFAVMTRRLRDETLASFGRIPSRMRQKIQRIASRALDDFRIRRMIAK